MTSSAHAFHPTHLGNTADRAHKPISGYLAQSPANHWYQVISKVTGQNPLPRSVLECRCGERVLSRGSVGIVVGSTGDQSKRQLAEERQRVMFRAVKDHLRRCES